MEKRIMKVIKCLGSTCTGLPASQWILFYSEGIKVLVNITGDSFRLILVLF